MATALSSHIEELRQTYSDEAPVYDEVRFGGSAGQLYNEAHSRAIIQLLRPGGAGGKPKRVLDIAAGTCRTSSRLVREGFEVVSLDITVEMLRVALHRSAGETTLQPLCADAFSLPFVAASFDAVICCRMLQMIPRQYYGNFGSEVGRVLKPGGLLVAELWNQLYRKIRHPGRRAGNSRGMVDTFVHPSERNALFGAGFEAEQVVGLGFPLVLRLGGRFFPSSSLNLYQRLGCNNPSRWLGETLLVQYHKR